MSRRYLFICPDLTTASGGIAVIYDTVATLRKAGYSAEIVHNGPYGTYTDHSTAPTTLYTPAIRKVQWKYAGSKYKVKEGFSLFRDKLLGGALKSLSLRRQDVLVVPEYIMPEAIEAFPENELIIFVQNSFSFVQSHVRGLDRGLDIRDLNLKYIGIADICMNTFKLFCLNNSFYLPVSMNPDKFPYQETKRALITYMPRKRPWEARVIHNALRSRLNENYLIEEIDKAPLHTVSQKLQESRIFISLLKTEALGFPAAEAMAAGCITVGFTGLGTEEYFDDTTGIPVPEGDIVALVNAVEAAAKEYEASPMRLDAMRRRASKRINARYSQAVFESNLLKIWGELHTPT